MMRKLTKTSNLALPEFYHLKFFDEFKYNNLKDKIIYYE